MKIRCKVNQFGDIFMTNINISDIQQILSDYRLASYNYMKENNFEHSVYATKEYNDDGKLIQLNLYQGYGFDNETFYKRMDNITDRLYVYACHNHK